MDPEGRENGFEAFWQGVQNIATVFLWDIGILCYFHVLKSDMC